MQHYKNLFEFEFPAEKYDISRMIIAKDKQQFKKNAQ
jgi:hypothetical protein